MSDLFEAGQPFSGNGVLEKDGHDSNSGQTGSVLGKINHGVLTRSVSLEMNSRVDKHISKIRQNISDKP